MNKKRKPSHPLQNPDTVLTLQQTRQVEKDGFCFLTNMYQNAIDNDLPDYLPAKRLKF